MTILISSFPKISIITPSYNQSRYLERTILSVLRQDYPNLEYIIMDGGSTDGSVEIIKKYQDKLSYWQSKPDDGQATAIDEGIKRSTGDIVAYINSDDIYLENSLWNVAEAFVKHSEVSWLIGRNLNIDSEGVIIRYDWPYCVTYDSILYWGGGFRQPASFWKREFYDEVGGITSRYRFIFDYELFLRFAKLSSPLRINKWLCGFRIHPESKSSTLVDVHRQELEDIRSKTEIVHSGKLQRKVKYYKHHIRWKLSHIGVLLVGPPTIPLGWPM